MISFNEIPAQIRVPFVYVEFDNSNAVQGPQVMPYKGLLIGQKTTAGTQPVLTPVRITSAAEAAIKFGPGSMLHRQALAWFANNSFSEVWAVAFAEPGGGVNAVANVTFSGTVTAAGVLALYIGGERVQIGVAAAETGSTTATNLVAAITANETLPVTAAVDGVNTSKVNITAKNKGPHGNDLDIRLNYFGETTPEGLTAAITPASTGAGLPDLTTLWPVLGEEFYNIWALPYTDSASTTAAVAELVSRAGPLRQIDAIAFMAKKGSVGTVGTYGDSLNSQFLSAVAVQNSPTHPAEYGAAVAATVCKYGQIDPARPFQTLELQWVKAPAIGDRFTNQERNLLLYDGIATTRTTPSGTVAIERMITTYKKNNFGADDPSYLDVNTLLTLSYIRYDLRNYLLRKYPRSKLANDGTKFGAGQAIVTPKTIKAECISKFREWESIGIVENIDQFKRDLIVERNMSDPNRLDILLPPDLVNQLRVVGVQVGFLLQEVKI